MGPASNHTWTGSVMPSVQCPAVTSRVCETSVPVQREKPSASRVTRRPTCGWSVPSASPYVIAETGLAVAAAARATASATSRGMRRMRSSRGSGPHEVRDSFTLPWRFRSAGEPEVGDDPHVVRPTNGELTASGRDRAAKDVAVVALRLVPAVDAYAEGHRVVVEPLEEHQ